MSALSCAGESIGDGSSCRRDIKVSWDARDRIDRESILSFGKMSHDPNPPSPPTWMDLLRDRSSRPSPGLWVRHQRPSVSVFFFSVVGCGAVPGAETSFPQSLHPKPQPPSVQPALEIRIPLALEIPALGDSMISQRLGPSGRYLNKRNHIQNASGEVFSRSAKSLGCNPSRERRADPIDYHSGTKPSPGGHRGRSARQCSPSIASCARRSTRA